MLKWLKAVFNKTVEKPYFDEILYSYAMSFVGKPYYWGGDDPMEGYDCSGLVIELLMSVGIFSRKYDATAMGIYYELERRSSHVPAGRFGCLAFYGSNFHKISHVGFCLDQFRMLEAGGGGPKVTDVESAKKYNAYIKIRHIESRKDLIAILRPSYSTIGAII